MLIKDRLLQLLVFKQDLQQPSKTFLVLVGMLASCHDVLCRVRAVRSDNCKLETGSSKDG